MIRRERYSMVWCASDNLGFRLQSDYDAKANGGTSDIGFQFLALGNIFD